VFVSGGENRPNVVFFGAVQTQTLHGRVGGVALVAHKRARRRRDAGRGGRGPRPTGRRPAATVTGAGARF